MNKTDFFVLAVAALALALGAGLAGYQIGSAKVERLERQHAEAVATTANATTERLLSAAQKNDALAAQVSAFENDLARATQEKNDALSRLTTGRRCLDAAAVRLLNAGPAAADRLPEAGGEPVSAAAGFATDQDVGQWAIACRAGYDTCRGRLDAIRQFYEPGDAP